MSKKPAKLTPRYMNSLTSQPVGIVDYVRHYIQKGTRTYSAVGMFARFLALMAARGFLTAGEIQYIVTGTYIASTKYADWNPEQELKEGRQPPTIKGA